MVANPITAAGVPPRKTMATTRARKLPEIFTFDSVDTALRSLKIEKDSNTANSGRSQLQAGARPTAAATVSSRPAVMTTIARRVGRGWTIFGLESANRERGLKESVNQFPSAFVFPARGLQLTFPLFANSKVRPLAGESARELAAWPNSPRLRTRTSASSQIYAGRWRMAPKTSKGASRAPLRKVLSGLWTGGLLRVLSDGNPCSLPLP